MNSKTKQQMDNCDFDIKHAKTRPSWIQRFQTLCFMPSWMIKVRQIAAGDLWTWSAKRASWRTSNNQICGANQSWCNAKSCCWYCLHIPYSSLILATSSRRTCPSVIFSPNYIKSVPIFLWLHGNDGKDSRKCCHSARPSAKKELFHFGTLDTAQLMICIV